VLNHKRLQTLSGGALGALLMASLAPSASAQVVFSIDAYSVTMGMPDTFTATPITEGDILMPAAGIPMIGPLPTPGTAISGGLVGLGLAGHAGCVGHPPGVACGVEVDAVSYGFDDLFQPNMIDPGTLYFSTDDLAVGLVGPALPNIMTEGPVVDNSADALVNVLPMPGGPLPPFGSPPNHTSVIDGNGMPSGSGAVYPGVGLIEPALAGTPFRDNIDALNLLSPAVAGTTFPPSGVYFSLDGFGMDPCSGIPTGGSAPLHGFAAASVLWTAAPGVLPVTYAPGPALGLDLIAGGQDDLDALIIHENGIPGYQPAMMHYNWLFPGPAGGLSDMLMFSVRRGSVVIGMPDSIFGIPIEEGDILVPPVPGSGSPFPGIWVAAENIGLMTMRSGTAGSCPDELNALDLHHQPFNDCNMNGVDDMIDIASGTSSDVNGNGIPDDCELIATPYCFCPAAAAPCGNPDPTAGCENSTTVGGLLTATGTSSVGNNDMSLVASQLPVGQFGIFFMGPAMIGPFPFGDGLRCVGGATVRFVPPILSDAAGTSTLGPGVAGMGGIAALSTWNFQHWYRDPGGPCASSFNLTHALSVTFGL